MAAENLGSLFNTKMPGYEDAADIQAALKLFLYGTTDDTIVNTTDPLELPNPSIARHLQELANDIAAIDARGVGSIYSATEPTTPADGFIWVDSSATASVVAGNIFYQADAPTGAIASGSIWTDSDSSPLTMYVYDAALGWREVGA